MSGGLDVAALYADLKPAVHGYFWNRLGIEYIDLIEDLVADTFERAVRGAPRYVDRGAHPSAWLMRIAHNILVDHYRDKRVTIVPLDWVRPLAATDLAIDQCDLRDVLERLTAPQHAVIQARFIDRLPISDTALVTGRTINGVKKLQERALVNLRKALGAA